MNLWDRLTEYLETDYAHRAVSVVLQLIDAGHTPDEIRLYLIKTDSTWWRDD